MSGSTARLTESGDGSDSGERERLGRFSLVGVIGRGASATVYEALDTRMGRPVALKVLSFDSLLTPEQRQRQIERFEREARAVARLSHPNIVSVYDVGEADGKHFLVMELLHGVTLRERIEQGGPIALGEAASLVEQIARALDSTHAEGIVHRDIKPSNVLLLPDGRVKMLDFGIARHGEDATVTHAGMLIGSPAYMSPEQGRGENASSASDIWALGALLYEMLTGHAPFSASHVAAVLYKAAYDRPEPLPSDVSAAQPVVDTALSKRPEDRYGSAGALAASLRAAAALSAPATTTVSRKATLESAAASAFVASATAEATAEAVVRPRSRLADFGVIAAWGAVGAVALTIVMVRMRQFSTAAPAVPVSGAKPPGRASVPRFTPPVVPRPPRPAPPKSPPKPSPTPAAPAPKRKIKPQTETTVFLVPTVRPAAAASSAAIAARRKSTPKPAAFVAAAKIKPPAPAAPLLPTATPSASSDRQPGKSPSAPSALAGRWQGNIGRHPAILTVQSSDGESFQGVAVVQTGSGARRFSVTGSFSPDTGRVSFWSAEASPSARQPALDLGQETGRLISPKTMGGIGVDSRKLVFTWSFSR